MNTQQENNFDINNYLFDLHNNLISLHIGKKKKLKQAVKIREYWRNETSVSNPSKKHLFYFNNWTYICSQIELLLEKNKSIKTHCQQNLYM